MERHKCKLCSRVFANGRALGGHMRSHLAALPIPPKTQQQQKLQLRNRTTDSASSLSSSEEEEEEEREDGEKALALVYGLRENPKKSFRLVDPLFLDAGSVSVVQDRESETDSSRKRTRRRSKRTRKMGFAEHQGLKLNKPKPSSTESAPELEPVSSVSDTSPEEDVALCLMMLSRDTWMSSDDSDELRPSLTRKKGGHRTSHIKVKSCFHGGEDEPAPPLPRSVVGTNNGDRKIHECPICYRVFGSGQALGGHKRSHLMSSSATVAPKSAKFGDCLVDKKTGKFGDSSLIDLNMPAPMEDEDFSQQEVSAVSDPEFTNPIEHGRH